jgi:type IV pilus assembly protein PilA
MYEKLQELRARKAEREGGFTLIELLVVVVIIGILIAIAIPLYLNYQKGAHDKSAQSDLRAAVSSLQQCYTDNGNVYPESLALVTGSTTTYKPSPAACASDVVNVSSGTTLTYTPVSGCLDANNDCTSFDLKSKNNGGSGKTYNYDSTAGGNIQ